MKRYLSTLFLIVLFFGAVPTVFAETKSTLKFDQADFLFFSSGKPLEEKVNLKNLSDQIAEVNLEWIPYSKSNTKVTSQDFLSKHSIDFAEIPEAKIPLQPFEAKTVTIIFNLPAGIISGDYYGTLLANSQQNTTQANFTIRVLGKLTETINANSYFEDNKLNISVTNMGNVATQLQISASLSGIFTSVENLRFNDLRLLSGQSSSLASQNLKLLPGYYQAKINLKYSDGGIEKILLVSFWVYPEFFLISLLTLLVSIGGFIYLRVVMKRHV